jgi:hypothetical protein
VAIKEIVTSEDIPDSEFVFLRVHKNSSRDGELLPAAFKPKGEDGLSVDWERYSTAEASRCRARVPELNGVARLCAEKIRAISIYDGKDKLDVMHSPISENSSHSLIKKLPDSDLEKTKVRKKLKDIAEIVIEVPV